MKSNIILLYISCIVCFLDGV